MEILHRTLLVYALFTVAQAETYGRKFLVAFLSNTGTTDPQLLITNHQSKPTSVVVSVPRNSSVPLHDVTIEGDQSMTLDVPYSLRMDTVGSDDNAILVDSSGFISLVGSNFATNSADQFLVFPVNTLGNRHTILTFSDVNYECEFVLIATHDNTEAHITHVNRTSVSLILGQFEAFRWPCDGEDLTGMEILSNATLAVFAGGNKMSFKGKSKGHLAEQLIPVQSWGRTFLAGSVSPQNDVLRIVVHNENVAVRIMINSTREWMFHIVHRYSFFELELGSAGSEQYLIEANDTVLLGQFPTDDYQSERSKIRTFTQIPAVEQFVMEYRLPGRLFTENSMHLSAHHSQDIELIKDGRHYPIEFESVFTESVMVLEPTPKGDSQCTLSSLNNAFGMTYHGETVLFSRLVNVKLIVQEQECIPTTPLESDAFDNDCDGRVDEEMANNKDDDGDKKIDEDTYLYQAPVVEVTSDSTTILANAEDTTQESSTDGSNTMTMVTNETQGNVYSSTTLSGNYSSQQTGQTITKTTSQDMNNSNITAEINSEDKTTTNNIPNSDTGNGEVTQRVNTEQDTGSRGQVTITTQGPDNKQDPGGSTGGFVPKDPIQSTSTAKPTSHVVSAEPQRGAETTQEEATVAVAARNDQTTKGTTLHDGDQSEQITSVGVTADDRSTPMKQKSTSRPADSSHSTTIMHEEKQRSTTGMPEDIQGPTVRVEPKPAPTTMTSEQGVGEENNNVDPVQEEGGITDQNRLVAEDTTNTPTTTTASPETEQKSVSADSMGILTIVAPSFVCGVPLLIVLFCCVRSIMAGVCRKKVSPDDKRKFGTVQPVWYRQPNY